MTTAEKQERIPEKLGKLPIAEFTSCPHEAFARLREASPAIPVDSTGYRYWVITRYEDVRRVLADPSVEIDLVKHGEIITSSCVVRNDALRPRIPRAASRSPFYQDGELHNLVRAASRNFFTAERVEGLVDKARDAAQGLLDKFSAGQPIDFMADYANPIAGKTLCAIAGIPDNERNMLATVAGESMMTPVISRVERSARLLVEWANELIEIKRGEPGDDVFTSLLRLHDEGKMTREELTSTYIVFLVGGMEVAIAIGNGAFSFLTHHDQLAKALAHPDLFTSGVDEIVRYESNFRFVAPHITTQPLHLDGVTVPAGELVLLCLGAANRDPSQFDDPDTFDITRVTTGHLGFGHGRHRCLGVQLGKAETAAALRLFFERFPRTTLVDPPDQAQWQPGKFQRRLESLPVIPF
ncbi:cytochrome P450 [Lentzea flava]|uniref:Cytochrome P450 n=1 Tax=Lentzea flava TaxID=103732 RepID=A0ABQ2VC76_9PSEU|nr:cytochrome P450 [Lentzea flava]MCP2204344.1 Cytochrome P450 [Lentzea flava]GGU76806.1 cytochrome P450 [Lentzea flava]